MFLKNNRCQKLMSFSQLFKNITQSQKDMLLGGAVYYCSLILRIILCPGHICYHSFR